MAAEGGGGGGGVGIMLQATAAVMRGRRRVSFFRPRTVGPCRPALPLSFPSSKNPPQSSLHGPDRLHRELLPFIFEVGCEHNEIEPAVPVCCSITIPDLAPRIRMTTMSDDADFALGEHDLTDFVRGVTQHELMALLEYLEKLRGGE